VPYTALYTIIIFYFNKYFLKNKKLFCPILLGNFIPDFDIFISLIGKLFISSNSIDYYSNKGLHSFFLILLVYFIGLIFSEILNKKLKIFFKGLSIGIFIHIILDILISQKGIYFLWPLNISFVSGFKINIFSKNLYNLLLASHFLLFRFYTWTLINKLIKTKTDLLYMLFPFNIWMKCEFYFFITLLFLIFIKFKSLYIIYMFFYIPSLIIATLSTYIIRKELTK